MMVIDVHGKYSGWNKIKEPLSQFINCEPEEIALTHNTTEGINIIAQGLKLNAGDEVIMTRHEHAGNAIPWLLRAQRDGIVLRLFDPKNTAAEVLEQIEALINSKTKVIAVPHISCIDGRVLPVKEISQLAKDKGLWCMIDGAHGPGSTQIDVKDIGCHFYATCGHKWMLGPKGTGFVYIGSDAYDAVEPTYSGGLALKDISWEVNQPQIGEFSEGANRFDFATQNVGLYEGLEEAVGFIQSIGIEKMQNHSRELSAYLQDKLINSKAEIEMVSPTEAISRGPMVGFRLKNRDFKEVAKTLSPDFRIRQVPEAGFDLLRVSTHIYNSKQEIDQLVAAIEDL
jgi:selenocysteine lyase/cysteine desulfurase